MGQLQMNLENTISPDSAYTERYMGLPTPEGNWKGFTESSLIGKAEYIQDNRYNSFSVEPII